MIDVAKSMPVNRDLEPGDPVLPAPDIWRGLVMKAENPVPFVKPITACTILERTANGLVREIVHKGETLRERITYHIGRSVTFVRPTASCFASRSSSRSEFADVRPGPPISDFRKPDDARPNRTPGSRDLGARLHRK